MVKTCHGEGYSMKYSNKKEYIIGYNDDIPNFCGKIEKSCSNPPTRDGLRQKFHPRKNSQKTAEKKGHQS